VGFDPANAKTVARLSVFRKQLSASRVLTLSGYHPAPPVSEAIACLLGLIFHGVKLNQLDRFQPLAVVPGRFLNCRRSYR
jgi:hypothetical protein